MAPWPWPYDFQRQVEVCTIAFIIGLMVGCPGNFLWDGTIWDDLGIDLADGLLLYFVTGWAHHGFL